MRAWIAALDLGILATTSRHASVPASNTIEPSKAITRPASSVKTSWARYSSSKLLGGVTRSLRRLETT